MYMTQFSLLNSILACPRPTWRVCILGKFSFEIYKMLCYVTAPAELTLNKVKDLAEHGSLLGMVLPVHGRFIFSALNCIEKNSESRNQSLEIFVPKVSLFKRALKKLPFKPIQNYKTYNDIQNSPTVSWVNFKATSISVILCIYKH